MKLTLPQQDVYYEQLMYPDIPIYNIGAKISIKGPIAYETLSKAYNILINQHDSYRSYVVSDQDSVIMQIHDSFDGTLEYLDFSSKQNADEAANKYMQETFKIPFDLHESKQLHKFILIKINETFHYLFSVYHHIITDGWATSLMFQRLVKNYNELLEEGKVVSEYDFIYKDFVEDDASYFSSESYQKDKTYWKEKFQELPEQLFDKPINKDALPKSSRKAVTIKRSTYNQLEKVGKELGCSTFHVILGLIFLYFGKKHQNHDFAIGLPVLNRGKFTFKRTVGLFMGIALLRVQLDEENTFQDLIKTIKSQLRLDYRHQRFPLGKLIKELSLFEDKGRLFNLTLSYEKQNYADHFLNTQTSVIPLSHQSERVALAMYIREFDKSEDVTLDFDYNVNYFSEREINDVTIHFQKLVTEVIENSERSLYAYDFLSEKEKDFLLNQLNETQCAYPTQHTFLEMISQQVKSNPDKIALEDETQKYTYAEIEVLSNAIANHFVNISEDDLSPIAVLMERSAELPITLLGVLKSGRAYIPLDPTFPEDRISYILAHSGVQQIIGNKKFENKAPDNTTFTDVETVLRNKSGRELSINKSELESTAYIIYTSGSTGKPKGVAISHRSLLNFLVSMQQTPGIETSDTLFSVTTQSFDISMLEFFIPLISGAKLYVANQQLLSDPLAIIEKITEISPSIMQATPSFYQMLYNAGWEGNKKMKVLCGGDLLSEALAERLMQTNSELWNMYGPTETTIWSTCKKIEKTKDANTIGKPIHNTQIYILDRKLQLLPVACAGEIYIGGDGLAQGYYKNEELTDERFVNNPFFSSSKIYRTGDLGKWNENGELEFLGRNDHQVKIRGYRIELGEIETRLNQLDEVKSSVVIAKKEENQEAVLIAYVIPEVTISDTYKLAEALKKDLPEYMIPYNIITLNEFPLTANKKIDRKALSIKSSIDNRERLLIKPATALEMSLQSFFKEILGVSTNISAKDNFFVLGGHSLTAVKLINLINKELLYRVTLKEVFENPSIQKLASYLEDKQTKEIIEIPLLPKQEYYDITPPQYYIWLASQHEEKSIAYNMTGVYRINGQIEKEILEQVFSEIVEKHEILRTQFVLVNGLPKQRIISTANLNYSIDEIFIENVEDADVLRSFANTSFDLELGSLLKIAIVYQKGNPCFLLFKTHHIIIDGWSIEILIKEVLEKYLAKVNGLSIEDEKLPFQFKEYANWYLDEVEKGTDKNTNFWTNYLQQYIWKDVVPKDVESAPELNPGSTIKKTFSSIENEKLIQFLQQHQISLHTFLVTAFNLLIYKMYGHQDICIGTVNAGRTSIDVERHLGMFAKTLPLRTQVNLDHTILALLHHTHRNVLNINIHQDIPASILETLRIDTLFVLQNTSTTYDQIKIGNEVFLEHYPLNVSYSRLPLLLNVKMGNEDLTIETDYNTACYEDATLEVLLIKYEKILQEIIENPNRSLEEINVDLEIEKQKTIAIDFNF